MGRLITLLGCLLLLGQGPAVAGDNPLVEIQTSAGNIRVEIYAEAAPITAANFLRYVDAGLYDGAASFYRTVRMDNQAQNAVKIEVIQGGLGMDEAGPAAFEPIAHETTRSTGVKHKDGAISMARLEPGSARSEFFICIDDQPELDYGGQRNPDGQGFAAFGQVLEGMDVVRRIQGMATVPPGDGELEYTSGQILLAPVAIERIVRLPRGDEISRQIDRDTWALIARSVADGDIETMAGTYHPDAVLVSEAGTRPISEALAGWGEGMQEAARAGSSAQVSFRFAQRLDDESTAFQTGIFKYVATSATGEESVQYVNFESLLVKQGDHWRFLMERQLGATDQAAWDALEP